MNTIIDWNEEKGEIGITRLLKKYAIVLIIFAFSNQFASNYLISLYFEFFPNESLESTHYTSVFYSIIQIAVNLIVALILLFDIPKSTSLTWLIFILALFAPWVGVVFFLLWRLVQIKKLEEQEHGD